MIFSHHSRIHLQQPFPTGGSQDGVLLAVRTRCIWIRQGTETALAPLKIGNSHYQVPLLKIRPVSRGQVKFGIGNLPQQKVAEPEFATCPNDQIGIRQLRPVKTFMNRLFVDVPGSQLARNNSSLRNMPAPLSIA